MLGLLPLTYYTSPLVENGVKARQNTQTNNQVFMESANARAMPVSTVGSQLFTQHWAAALPIEVAAAIVLSRWCATEAPWRL